MEQTTLPIPDYLRQTDLSTRFKEVRKRTEEICSYLKPEDFPVQPVVDVSPPKWHLAHTTWFFEAFFMSVVKSDYDVFDPTFAYHFNSYYNTVGKRVLRANRGLMSRPETSEIFRYRQYVDEQVLAALGGEPLDREILEILELGLQHEMQHQELLLTDIKYILGHQPFFPVYNSGELLDRIKVEMRPHALVIEEGVYSIGYEGGDFFFDNEQGRHRVFLEAFEIENAPVSFGQYLEFIEDGGYDDFRFWHSDAWDYINKNEVKAPLYVHKIDGEWNRYTLSGLRPIDPDEVLIHVSYYEAAAFAEWKGKRLPTEFEWEVASDRFKWGDCWEWTNSAYLPYPNYQKAGGALGEYNGKFMINQMVLKGASKATFPGHSRKTYRNFFHPHLQWQYAGIRLAK